VLLDMIDDYMDALCTSQSAGPTWEPSQRRLMTWSMARMCILQLLSAMWPPKGEWQGRPRRIKRRKIWHLRRPTPRRPIP
jgi:hypothetical protein